MRLSTTAAAWVEGVRTAIGEGGVEGGVLDRAQGRSEDRLGEDAEQLAAPRRQTSPAQCSSAEAGGAGPGVERVEPVGQPCPSAIAVPPMAARDAVHSPLGSPGT